MTKNSKSKSGKKPAKKIGKSSMRKVKGGVLVPTIIVDRYKCRSLA